MGASGTTYRWVAARGDARACANAVFTTVLHRTRLWVFLGIVVVGFALFLRATGTGLFVALLLSAGWMLLVTGTFLGLRYAATRRRLRRQLPEGLVLESEFGPDFLVLRGPSTESRISFAGIDQIRRGGDWVLMRQSRSRMLSCWPLALFPPEELARVEAAVAKRP